MRCLLEHIRDGDTLVVTIGTQSTDLRLYGIDCPELDQEPYGQLARSRLQELLGTHPELDVLELDRDHYDRLVAEVWVGNCCINTQLLREGFAVAYRFHLQGKYRQRYITAEAIAKRQKLQLWSQPELEMPWEYRRRIRGEG
jgi:micrococcal nuclease